METLRKIWKKFGRASTPHIRPSQTIHQIAVFGYADATRNDRLFKNVVEVCKKLAEAGYVIVDGGGPGVMRAATIGAKQGGGKVVGVILNAKDIPNFEGKDPKNLIDEEIRTETYIERTLTLMRKGQAYLVFNGGTGTISEFGMAWGLARIYFGHHKPLILYGKFWKEIIKTLKRYMLLRDEELEVFKIVDSPEEVLEALDKFEQELLEGKHKHLQASKEGAFSL